MAHGMRGRWMRVAATGLGVLVCTGLVGCWNADKPKDSKIGTKQTQTGLPGTPRLDSSGNPISSRTAQPNSQFGGAGANQSAGGYNNPAAGMGASSTGLGQRYPTNGTNTNAGGLQPAGGYMNYQPSGPSVPGGGGMIGAPAVPGQQPMVPGGLGYSPGTTSNSVARGNTPTEPAPNLGVPPLPPPAPDAGTGNFAPVAPPSSLAPPTRSSSTGQQPTFNSAPDAFGGR